MCDRFWGQIEKDQAIMTVREEENLNRAKEIVREMKQDKQGNKKQRFIEQDHVRKERLNLSENLSQSTQ